MDTTCGNDTKDVMNYYIFKNGFSDTQINQLRKEIADDAYQTSDWIYRRLSTLLKNANATFFSVQHWVIVNGRTGR